MKKQRLRNRETELLSSWFQINYKFKLRRLLYRKIGGLGSLCVLIIIRVFINGIERFRFSPQNDLLVVWPSPAAQTRKVADYREAGPTSGPD